jgi:hypothetical protein
VKRIDAKKSGRDCVAAKARKITEEKSLHANRTLATRERVRKVQ